MHKEGNPQVFLKIRLLGHPLIGFIYINDTYMSSYFNEVMEERNICYSYYASIYRRVSYAVLETL